MSNTSYMSNVMEHHRENIDEDFTLVERKNMRRGKPQASIYKPGSGKLRRSNPCADDTLSESGSTKNHLHSGFGSKDDLESKYGSGVGYGTNRDTQKRTRKPEREYYIPRPVAQTREHQNFQSPQNYSQDSSTPNDSESNMYNDKINRSKRYSSNRNHGDNTGRTNNQNEWRDKSPPRNFRMGSEPRGGFNTGPNWHRDRDHDRHRDRDTRSVEPSGGGGRSNNPDIKIQTKPPSGRRHSTTGNYQYEQERKKNLLKMYENLGPRLRKKFMEENNLTPEDVAPYENNSQFQLHAVQQHHQNSGFYPPDAYGTLPHATAPPAYSSNQGYHTLPSRPRGRGRFHHPEPEFQPGPPFRSVTPERASIPRSPAGSRPGTPTRRFDNKPASKPPSRSQTPIGQFDDSAGRYGNNDTWGGKSAVYERLGGRVNEHRDRDRDRRNNEYTRSNKDEDNRNRRGEDYSNRRRDNEYTRSNRDDRRADDFNNRRGNEYNNRRDDYRNKREDDYSRRDDYRNKRNELDRRGDGDRDRKDHHRKGKKKTGRDRRSSSRDLVRHDSKDSGLSNDSNRTLIDEVSNAPPNRPSGVTEDETQPAVNVAEELEAHQAVKVEEKIPDVAADSVNDLGNILDWNEEVELSYRLEAEALSDALTRSSSTTSLQEMSTRSTPASTTTTPKTQKKRKSDRRKSKQRSGSNYRDKTPTSRRDRNDSFVSVESRDNFKVPSDPVSTRRGRRGRRSSRDQRDPSFERFHNRSRGASRDVSFERNQSAGGTSENWRDEIIRSRQNSEREGSVVNRRISSDRSRRNSELDDHVDTPSKKAGILVLPSKSPEPPHSSAQRPKFPEIKKAPGPQKTLFDPKNPNKPILVKSPGGRVSIPGFPAHDAEAPRLSTTDSSGKVIPVWYNETSDEFISCHFPDLLRDIRSADLELQLIVNSGMLLVNYETVDNLRQFLKSALEYLLCKSIKFCQKENVEQHIWRILYHNIIEITRKAIVDDPNNKPQYKGFLLYLIDEGTKYFERLIGMLEDTYNFKVANYIGNNSMVQNKGLGYTGLALISAQKIFLFLGDLGRYREQVNETSNYGKCRQWYIKSHEINPKNGKPYNQLAVLAVYSRRKLDAVYYYMRSLMSSNPVPSARDSLVSLFDENRKKYEQGEKKRREERMERQRQHMKQKESEENGTPNFLRKETWIHPEGGRRLYRTTKALQEDIQDSEEDLASLSSVDVNKRFVTSYLHVHGKLITKIGMESFQDAAIQMLKEFRVLLQHSPVSLPCNRFLQLLALNMFAIDSTQLKDLNLEQSAGYRSELQERALIVSLQMFNLILERCVSILQDHHNSFRNQEKSGSPLDCMPHDANVLLPAIKVWCDWMLCHTSVWNPPPSTHDFKVGPSGDLWSRLGLLMNILEQMDQGFSEVFVTEPKEGYEPVRLPEDATLSGFTPLFHDRETAFAPVALEPENAQSRLRIAKLLFFGTVYLCGLELPVLKLEIEDGRRDYVSVVRTDRSLDSPRDEAVLIRNEEVLLETFSGDEDDAEEAATVGGKEVNASSSEASSEVRNLLTRKLELEKRNRNQELHQQRVMKILSQSVVSVHLEILPKNLVPDTNCFIDHLESIQTVAKSHTYTLMVPIVVLSELEGLSKGSPSPTARSKQPPDSDHVQKVAAASRLALEFLKKRHAAVKCVTTKGAVLPSTNFCIEDDATWDATVKNDDKILTTCLVICKNHHPHRQESKEGEPRHLFRETVLLTEDRNLRVKAHARDVPVRALPDFMRWAGLGG